ncbi:MAG TPA: sensor histidine kinase [Longimicrobiales bacterium]
MSERWRLLPDDKELGWTPYAWLIYLPTFLIEPITRHRAGDIAGAHWVITIAALAVFLASYFYGYWARGNRLVAVAGLQTALGVAFAPINVGSFVLFIYAASFVAQLADRRAPRYIVGIAVVAAITAWLTDAPLFFWIGVVLTLMIGGINLHYARFRKAQRQLRRAEREVQHMAAVAERERIARDLHDVLGHTLSLIVLKSELASKLTARDPQRAAQEIKDIETVARQALHDVRDTIRGIRPSLDDELERARSLLKAAGVEPLVNHHPLRIDKAREETLAFLVREAATNVARHAKATRCTITVAQQNGTATLHVQDNGKAGRVVEGNGMRGMRERVEALGGAMHWEAGSGLHLRIELPTA